MSHRRATSELISKVPQTSLNRRATRECPVSFTSPLLKFTARRATPQSTKAIHFSRSRLILRVKLGLIWLRIVFIERLALLSLLRGLLIPMVPDNPPEL